MWPTMDEKARKDASEKDETVLFNAIGEVSVFMSQLGIDVAYVKKFISKCSTACRLGNNLTSSLTTFATKIIETQKANSDSLLDIRKAKIVPPEKTAERLFKFSKRVEMSHDNIIRYITQLPQMGSVTKIDDDDVIATLDNKDWKPTISHGHANEYDIFGLEANIGNISCVEVYKNMVFIGTKTGNIAVWELTIEDLNSSISDSSEISLTDTPKLILIKHICDSGISFISPGKTRTAILSEEGSMVVFDTNTGKILKTYLPESTYVTAVVSNSDFVASGTEDGCISLWDTKSLNTSIANLEGHKGPILSLVFGKHNTLISGGADKTVRVWNLKTYSEKVVIEGYDAEVKFILPIQSSKIVAASEDEAKMLDLKKKILVKEFDGIKPPIASYEFIKKDSCLLTLSESGMLLSRHGIFENVSSSLKLSSRSSAKHACSIGNMGEITVVGFGDGTIHLWRNFSKASLHTFRGHTTPIIALKNVSPKIFLSASEGPVVNIWKISDEALAKWAEGCLLIPKVENPDNDGIFRFKFSSQETSSISSSNK